jgi:hypothetical protein
MCFLWFLHKVLFKKVGFAGIAKPAKLVQTYYFEMVLGLSLAILSSTYLISRK